MSKYDIYGIGNALVDLVFEVDEKFLTDNQVEKGLMTLVEEDRQKELISQIKVSENMMKGGGSAANTVVAASQFGGSSYYACKVSNDEFGAFYLKDLATNGVDTILTEATAPEGLTGRCLVMTTPDAERTMNTFLGITSDFSVAEIDEEAIKNSTYLYTEGYLVPSQSGRDAMKKGMEIARAHGVKVSLSFSDPSMVKFFNDEMKEVVGEGVDLLFCNEEEAMLYTATDSLLDAREALKAIAKKFVITLGQNGAMIFDGDTFVDIEPYKVEAIDTNGAGDMFAGAFLYGITHGHSFAESGKLASLAASKVVSQFGPRLEKAQALEVLSTLS
ncbi:adenosine kinase [Reichenbachiella sp. MSK19-1]|uniref:adenosine kinase n=1 Tax=Reichenbachiella sp. MSK19-1 TaxID=1897631 RepID=UPI000E6B91CF|nr:adenosine kinase [Reichenbachiella sp. MSK19-1]RJE70349.1 sugar kinase [Reichenbachiella sp. MSK19-1]